VLYLSGSTRFIRNSEHPNFRAYAHSLVDEGAYVLYIGSSFQHAVVRSINDKNAQLQKQLENLVREGTYFFHLFLVEKPKKIVTLLLRHAASSGQRDQPIEQQIIW
jgi:hypothetical protein